MGKGLDKQMVRGCQIHIYLWLIKRPLSAQHEKSIIIFGGRAIIIIISFYCHNVLKSFRMQIS